MFSFSSGNRMMRLSVVPRGRPGFSAHRLRNYAADNGGGLGTIGQKCDWIQLPHLTKQRLDRKLSVSFDGMRCNLYSRDGKGDASTNSMGSSKSRVVRACNSLADKAGSSLDQSNKKLAVVTWSAITLSLAVVNRVLHKLALVPMKDYPLVLAQINTFVFVAVYFPLLYVRYRAGLVTDEMLDIPKAPFIVMGFLESISLVSGMYAGAILPGPVIPLLYQTFLVWQLVFSKILLRKTYSLNQVFGCFLVAAGVVVALASGSTNGQMLSGIGISWPALMVLSSAFQAGASIVKESVFLDASTRLKGKLLDVSVVNSFGSGVQAMFVVLCLPIISQLKGQTLPELLLFFKSGTACFLNPGGAIPGCGGAPFLPLLFIISSILFNISVLNLLKFSNAIVASLAVRASVPFAIYALSLPLPYLPAVESLSPFFHLGSMILVAGLVLYNLPQRQKQVAKTA